MKNEHIHKSSWFSRFIWNKNLTQFMLILFKKCLFTYFIALLLVTRAHFLQEMLVYLFHCFITCYTCCLGWEISIFFCGKHIGSAILNIVLWATNLISVISQSQVHQWMFPENYKIFFHTSSFSLIFHKILMLLVLIFFLVLSIASSSSNLYVLTAGCFSVVKYFWI